MINCAGCGANMRFDPKLQMLKCDYCDMMADPKNLNADIVSPESKIRLENDKIYEAKVYTCPQCGAELICDDDTAGTFCSYCGASVMFDERTVTMKAPSYVIPFKKTKEECGEIYSKFVKNSLFAPKYLRENDTVERFRGIYMPYWVYDMAMDKDIALKGEKTHRSGDYIITDHYNLMSHVKSNSNGVSFDASAAFADELSQSIAPYNFKECEKFSAGYLSGFYVDTADVKARVYEDEAKNAVASDIITKVTAEPIYSKYSVKPSLEEISSKLTVVSEDMAYFPVWFLANTQEGYVSYAVVNGQTGKVCADVPIDYKKYIIGSLLLALPIMLVLDFIVTPIPSILAAITAIFAIIIYFIADSELNSLYTRRFYLDDRGLRSRRNEAMPENLAQSGKKTDKKVVSKTANAFKSVSFIAFIALGIVIELGNPMLVVGGFALMFAGVIGALIAQTVRNSSISTNGIRYKRKKLVFKQPFKEKWKVLIKPLIAIGCCGLLLIINPFIDIVYYCCVFAVMILVLTSVWDIVSVHNKLTKRLPKQFGVRGGAENEN